jgi:hypothetical protein
VLCALSNMCLLSATKVDWGVLSYCLGDGGAACSRCSSSTALLFLKVHRCRRYSLLPRLRLLKSSLTKAICIRSALSLNYSNVLAEN